MRKFIILFFLFALTDAFATHNRAGEITYEHISGYTYKIRITTYTRESSVQADRCELPLYFGDGDSAIVYRNNGLPGNPCPNGVGNGISLGNDVKENIYEVVHTFPGNGTYIITMEDPNRNEGVCNIPSSSQASFFLRTELIINPFLGINNSPVLLNKPIDNACVGECFEHNPGAFDADGDSLTYSLIPSYANGIPIFGFTLPPSMSLGDIDPIRGDLLWCSPTVVCQYNIAILIEEYRLLPGSSKRYYVGSILRDMQINVNSCINNPPKIQEINDTCIAANTNLNMNVTAADPDLNILTLIATGGPMELNPNANFVSTPSFTPVTGLFSWTPNCKQVRLLPYLVTFKVTDSNINPLVDYKSVFIKVIAPAPSSVTATPSGASITVNWKATSCNDSLGSNPLLGYKIYRKNSCTPLNLNACQDGVPESSGYKLIGSTQRGINTFNDNDNGKGLVNGTDYSYVIVAHYSDGSQSYASTNVCAKLVRDIPIITNVSVISTGTNDSIFTHWVKPIGTLGNLDTVANPAPYEYRLMRAPGITPSNNDFKQVTTYTFQSFYKMVDTNYISTQLNTQDSAYTFRIDFYSKGNLIGSTNTASSVFLSLSPTDNKMNLSWKEAVPWTNYRYDVYRETIPGSNTFTFLDSTTVPNYVDTGLVNGTTYCYKITSIGQYSDTNLPRPLYNNSQIGCGVPIDRIPPCQPTLTIESDCQNAVNSLSWLNPNTYCSDDGRVYYIYYANTRTEALVLIDSIPDINTLTYLHEPLYENIISVAGCYAVTAIDSTGNESVITTKQCVDNCPVYNLPNVFSPNGDGVNDFFIPILPYKYVKDIEFQIYNRWGTVVFETKDANIAWDGKNSKSKKPCPDGVYFYICTINEIRVDGIAPRVIKGYIQLFNEEPKKNN